MAAAAADAEQLDRAGQALLQQCDIAGARELFERSVEAMPLLPFSHNNLALCAYLVGDLELALAHTDRVLEQVAPGNPFALAARAQYLLWLGRAGEAAAAADAAAQAAPDDGSGFMKICETLAHLRRDGAIVRVWERCPQAASGEPEAALLVATALANCDRPAEAQALLASIPAATGQGRAGRLRRALRRGLAADSLDGRWPYFGDPGSVIPAAVIERARRELRGDAGADLSGSPHRDMLERLVELEIDACAGSKPELARLLACLGSPRAVELLHAAVSGRFGSDQFRLEALTALTDLGEIAPGQAVPVWNRQRGRRVPVRMLEISEDAVGRGDLDSADLAAYADAIAALNDGRPECGLQLLDRLARCHRTEPSIEHNRAIALNLLGRRPEAEQALERATAIDPHYLPAHGRLAQIRMAQGRLGEARAILDAAAPADRVHPQVYARHLAVWAELEARSGDPELARALIDQAAVLAPGDGAVLAAAALVSAEVTGSPA